MAARVPTSNNLGLLQPSSLGLDGEIGEADRAARADAQRQVTVLGEEPVHFERLTGPASGDGVERSDRLGRGVPLLTSTV
jgi:hypothetical protein